MTVEQKGKIISCFCNGVEFKESMGMPDEYEALAELLSKTLDRQTPMKVAPADTGAERCPACNSYLQYDCFGKAGNFCSDCGQALDWSEK